MASEELSVVRDLAGRGLSWAEVSRQTGLSYGRVYRMASRDGLVAARADQWRRDQAQAHTRKAEDRKRFAELLRRYENGEMVPELDPAAVQLVVVDALLVQPALEAYRERGTWERLLSDLDTLDLIKQQEEFAHGAADDVP